jgi:CRISPR-associated protein Cmr2
VCRRRAALFGPYEAPSANEDRSEIDHRRSKTREFWAVLDEEGEGRDRLCGVCALKRFLVEASKWEADGFNSLWAGREELARLKEQPRVPFPSTAAVAAQVFLAEVAQNPKLAALRREVVTCHDDALRAAGKKGGNKKPPIRTAFARALPRLAAAETTDVFLQLDTQTSIFPSSLRARAEEKGVAREKWQRLYRAVTRLRDRARALDIDSPRTRLAVVRLDGDRLGALLLGHPEQVATTWHDVLHPKQIEEMKKDPEIRKTGWIELFDCRRLMGPSLHAFISRVLAEFSHRVVPWVVEREFGGRLIYAGGDDLLALAPAEDALPMAARLNQLFSAAWVVDTAPEPDPWAWRRHDHRFTFDPDAARGRFAILHTPRAETEPASLPFEPDDLETPVGTDRAPARAADGELLAMLGPGASLSAGIAYAHFKTPLGHLLQKTGRLLHQAKDGGRATVGLSYSSRGGEKARVVLPWAGKDGTEAYKMVELLVEGFRGLPGHRPKLPGRLPYKLREMGESVPADLPEDRRDLLLYGLLLQALDGEEPGRELEDAALTMWRRGFDLARDRPGRTAEGLLLCRALAGDDVEEDFG